MMLWILHISHAHGDDYSLHLSADDAEKCLHAYCLEQWDEGLSEQYGTPDELSRDDCIEAYFDAWHRALDPETYMLEPCELAGMPSDGTAPLMSALEMAMAAMNQAPGFDTGIACCRTNRSLSSYDLLSHLEHVLQTIKGQTGPKG